MNPTKAKKLVKTSVFYNHLAEITAIQSTVWADVPKIGWMITYTGVIGLN